MKNHKQIVDDAILNLTMGQKLRMFRELNNYSQEQVGKLLKVSEKTISAWETGEREINLNNARLICEVFKIPNSYFVFNENFNSLDYSLRDKIRVYVEALELRNRVENCINRCKQKLIDDGIPCKKEYLPVFDYSIGKYASYGIFSSLPESYSSAKLAEYGLYSILRKYNGDKVEIADLTNCNNIDIFKSALSTMRTKTYTAPYSQSDISTEYIQKQLNETLENLNPNLSNFWLIIVFLIENGAYYTKQFVHNSLSPYAEDVKDISKTNLVYRLAKDKSK